MKKYVCPVCGKEFDSLTALKADIVMHENEEKVAVKAKEAAEKLKQKQEKEKALKELEEKINQTYRYLIALTRDFNSKSENKTYVVELKEKQLKSVTNCAAEFPKTFWELLNGKF